MKKRLHNCQLSIVNRQLKRPLALLLCAVLLLAGLSVTAAAAPDFFFVAVDYEILPLESAYTPIRSGGKVYAPVDVLTAPGTGIYAYSISDRYVRLLGADSKKLEFDVASGKAYDDEWQYDYMALWRNGMHYLPAETVCAYFKLTCKELSTDYGPLLRIRVRSAESTDQNFLYAARNILKEKVDAYNDAQAPPVSPPASPPVSATPTPAQPIAYLTIDDGPTREYTDRILDILDTYGVKATFFILGANMSINEPVIRRIIGSGHAVGVHAYTHEPGLVYASPAALVDEMERANDRLEQITLHRSRLTRIPYGSGGNKRFTEEMCQALTDAGYRFWDWTVDGDNASGRNARKTAAAISAGVISDLQSPGVAGRPAVILLHERPMTVEALPAILDYMTKRDYIFVTCAQSERPYNFRSWIK